MVVLPEIDPAAYSDKDLEELNSTLSSLENAVVVLGSVFELERSKLKTGKRAQKLIAQCKALGYTEELAKPKPFELKMMMIDRAKEQKTTLPDGAAAALLERCGEDPFLLENELDKLCALSGYQTVTAAMVAEMGTVSLEADVFEMIRMITAKNATGACKKLQTLLRLQQEPIAITAAMICTGSSWGQQNGKITARYSRILAIRAVITGSSGRPKQPRIIRWARSKTVCRCCWNWTRA